MTLDVVGELPAGVGLMVDVPFDLHDAMRLAHPDGERYVDDDTGEARVRVPFEPAARGRPLGSATFGPRDRHRIRLRVTAGALAGREPFEVAVRQLHAGVPLGAVTWRLRPGPPTA